MASTQVQAGSATASDRLPFDRLLVPIDFSWASREAFTVAMGMADLWKSKVIVFYAPGPDANDEFLGYTGVSWGRGDVVGEAYGQLSRFADTVIPGSAERLCIDAVPADDPVRAVADACERHRPTLIILGTNDRDRHRWSRSRAERIVRAVTCPVMMVRAEREPQIDPD